MKRRREPKKSETLEVRLPHEVKTALMCKASAEGRSASEVVRESIGAYLADTPKEARNMLITAWKPAVVAGTAVIGIAWSAMAPTPLAAAPDLRAVFQSLDRNNDGVLSAGEFVQHTADPGIQKLHDAHKDDGHQGMAASHGAAHAKPSAETLRAHFARLDANSDGTVKLEELEAFHDEMNALHGTR